MLKHLSLSQNSMKALTLALVLIILGISLILLTTGHSFMGMALIFIGAVMLYYIWCVAAASAMPSLVKVLRVIVTIGLLIGLTYFCVVESFIIKDSHTETDEPAIFIIVLGAGVNGKTPSLSLRDRLNGTYDYMTSNPECIAILSGGQGPGEDITEALCMYEWLIDKGISAERLIIEDQATCTLENLRYSMDIIESLTNDDPVIGLVSSEYHLHRAKLMAESEGIDVIGIAARTSFPTVAINYFIREAFAMTEIYVFGVEGL